MNEQDESPFIKQHRFPLDPKLKDFLDGFRKDMDKLKKENAERRDEVTHTHE